MNKNNTILFGVGQAVLRDFVDQTKIYGLTKLQNLTISSSGNTTDIMAGDNPYAWATFPQDKAITVSAQNANFNLNMLNITQGAEVVTAKAVFTEVLEVTIPADGAITLEYAPVSVNIVGFDVAADLASIQTGQFVQDTVDEKIINFATADAGKIVEVVYEWETSADTQTMSVLRDTFAKPFKFTHRIPVYDDNSQVVAQAQLTIFKARASNNFEFNLQQNTAFAPTLELTALDPKRADKKLWDFSIAPV